MSKGESGNCRSTSRVCESSTTTVDTLNTDIAVYAKPSTTQAIDVPHDDYRVKREYGRRWNNKMGCYSRSHSTALFSAGRKSSISASDAISSARRIAS